MSEQCTFPVLTQTECQEMLDHVRGIGPVKFPWEFTALATAITLMICSLFFLMLHSWLSFATVLCYWQHHCCSFNCCCMNVLITRCFDLDC